eukprot:1137318-Pelagomonas_calceolata.AAC.1
MSPLMVWKVNTINVASRIITEAPSKSPWGAGLVYTDIGNDDWLAQHNPQTSKHASNITLPPYLIPCSFFKRSRLTSRRPTMLH